MSDVDVVLVGPGGQAVILMSDVSGSVSGRTYTFDDTAATALPSAAISGTYRPTNSSSGDTFPAPGPGNLTQPGTPLLSVFNSSSPNGTWNLFIVDDFGLQDSGAISGGWSIAIQTRSTDCSTTAIVPTSRRRHDRRTSLTPTGKRSGVQRYARKSTRRKAVR